MRYECLTAHMLDQEISYAGPGDISLSSIRNLLVQHEISPGSAHEISWSGMSIWSGQCFGLEYSQSGPGGRGPVFLGLRKVRAAQDRALGNTQEG